MNYIARYIPLNGEIKVGDRVQSESFHKAKVLVTGITEKGDYITDEADVWEYDSYFILPKDKAKRFSKELYLITTDIEVGDKVNYKLMDSIDIHEGICTDICDGAIILVNNKEEIITVEEDNCFKNIGKISPDAVWVKEGDKFDESQIHKCFVPDKGDPMVRQVKIKCPCCNTYK